MILELFYEDRTNNLCAGAHKRNVMRYGQRAEFLVSSLIYLECNKYNKISTHIFDKLKNMHPLKYAMNRIHNLFTEPCKRVWIF